MARTLKDQAAIVGIGQTEFSKNSGRSELQLACEAVRAAIRDAGLKPSDVDGMTIGPPYSVATDGRDAMIAVGVISDTVGSGATCRSAGRRRPGRA